jgi:hypothetical protein
MLENGSWFDLDRATIFSEGAIRDGNNWDHEELARTATGRFVLHVWSQREGSRDSWILLGVEEAYGWLLRNGHADAVLVVKMGTRNLDDSLRSGSPIRSLRIPDDLWDRIQAQARVEGLDATKLMLRQVQEYLHSVGS